MTDKIDDGRVRHPLEEGEDKASRLTTSGNREESMTESGKDAFGRKSAVRNPDSTSQGDGTTDTEDATVGRSSGQSAQSSGTESLGGETRGSAERKGPGGVEGHD